MLFEIAESNRHPSLKHMKTAVGCGRWRDRRDEEIARDEEMKNVVGCVEEKRTWVVVCRSGKLNVGV